MGTPEISERQLGRCGYKWGVPSSEVSHMKVKKKKKPKSLKIISEEWSTRKKKKACLWTVEGSFVLK